MLYLAQYIYNGDVMTEMILRRDSRIGVLLSKFEKQSAGDSSFLEALHELISKIYILHVVLYETT